MNPRAQSFVRLADEILARIDEELGKPGAPSAVKTAVDLAYAARRIRAMRQRAVAGKLPERSARYPVLTRLILDHWRLSGELGRLIIELEQRYEKL
jgi:hypothetical protein